MSLLLDTMVASELRKARHAGTDPVFAAWAEAARLSDACVSVITIHELERGVLLVERKDPARGSVHRAWLDEFQTAFRSRVLPLTIRAARLAAAFHVPDPARLADSLIAGSAKEHGLTIATRNSADFARFGLPLTNPWEPGAPHR
ncbi:MAG: type II toxin-antitoxin system VapC family toxin [Propionibacteriaceae bacterium]|jgi:predicted nucleic acid-binding protein|nr:type II toxin-antitoxin system VapC family toxin [Propionibacteriaceae bacterium]